MRTGTGEDTIMKRTWMTTGKAATGVFLPAMALVALTGMALMLPSPVAAVSMTDYTSSPPSATNSPSVLASSFTGEGAIFQAFFFAPPSVNCGPNNPNEVCWTGLMQGLFIDQFGNIREDYSASGCTGPPDGKLVLTHDCIIRVRVETDPTSPNFNSVVVDRFKDDGTAPGSTAGDGIADTTTPEPGNTVPLSNNGQNNVHPIWEGGRRLALLSPGDTCESSSTWPKASSLTESGRNC